jgi:F420-dependent oxidoreductase-like protein
MGDIKLGYNTGYWSAGPPAGALEAIKEAERLGFDSVWTAEAYGSDALTPLAWWGAHTERIKLGTAIMQMSARTPAATAMAAMSLDHLSGGRFILGLGASGPQVVEGWYGEPYPKPLVRTREYVEIVRRIVAREGPVEFHGDHYDMPLQGGSGLGKALKSTIHPLRTTIPIYLAAEGPKNVALAAEICDGWLPMFFSPSEDKFYRERLAEGFAAGGVPSRADTFEIAATVTIIPGDDVEACADFIRPFLALYAGGMGARGANFHFEVFARMGYEDVATRVQELYLEGKKQEAAAAIPLEMVEDVALVGPPDKIRAELDRWRETCLTTILIGGPAESLGAIADMING